MQNRKIITTIIAAMLTLTAAAQDKTVKVACIGNSITEGYALADPSKDSYPAVLQQMLGEGYQVENFGLSGHTLLMKGNQPYMARQRYKEALAFNPDIVTIKLGTNDSKPVNWAHGGEFKRDLETMVNAFRQLPSHPEVYLCLPVPAETGKFSINDSVITHGVIPCIKQVAAELHLPVIDLNTALRPFFPEAYADGVHPNELGAHVIAACIYCALTGRDSDD